MAVTWPDGGRHKSPSLPLAFRPELPPGPLPANGGPSLAVPTRTTVKAFQRSACFFETCGVLRRRGRKCGLALNRIGSACALYAPSGPRPAGGKNASCVFSIAPAILPAFIAIFGFHTVPAYYHSPRKVSRGGGTYPPFFVLRDPCGYKISPSSSRWNRRRAILNFRPAGRYETGQRNASPFSITYAMPSLPGICPLFFTTAK